LDWDIKIQRKIGGGWVGNNKEGHPVYYLGIIVATPVVRGNPCECKYGVNEDATMSLTRYLTGQKPWRRTEHEHTYVSWTCGKRFEDLPGWQLDGGKFPPRASGAVWLYDWQFLQTYTCTGTDGSEKTATVDIRWQGKFVDYF